jgi:hypothetical protein
LVQHSVAVRAHERQILGPRHTDTWEVRQWRRMMTFHLPLSNLAVCLGEAEFAHFASKLHTGLENCLLLAFNQAWISFAHSVQPKEDLTFRRFYFIGVWKEFVLDPSTRSESCPYSFGRLGQSRLILCECVPDFTL